MSARTPPRPFRNFAFGDDVLPVDTNVRRVQERTGHAFSARTAQALMDLGATICLARVPRCGVVPALGALPVARPPLRAAAPAVAVRGLVPERRANALRAILAGDAADDAEAVAALARDGLLSVDDGIVALPT